MADKAIVEGKAEERLSPVNDYSIRRPVTLK